LMRTAIRCSFTEGGNLTVTTSLLYDTEATPVSAPLHTLDHPHTDALLGAHSADEYASLMHSVVDSLGERFRTTERAASAKDRTGLQAAVDAVDLDTAGVGNAEALREVDALYADNAVWFHHPSYVAHLNCPVAVPAVAAEAMLAAINTSVDTYDQSEVATLMERRLVDWTSDHLGFADGDGISTSGGTQSNLQALFLARENVLAGLAEGRTAGTAAARAGGAGDAPTDTGDAPAGTGDAPADGGSATRRDGPSDRPTRRDRLSRLRILATDPAHFSVARAAFLLGLDAEAVVPVPTDAAGRPGRADAPANGGSATRRAGPSDRPTRRDRLSRLRILATDQAHFSVARAAFLLGLDAEAVVTVPTDAAGRMDAEALRASLLAIEANGAIPMAVVATAGTTDLGVIDPLEPIAEVCEAANVWLHVDAAYGGGLLWAPRRVHLLDGIGRAASVTIDFHKTFFQP